MTCRRTRSSRARSLIQYITVKMLSFNRLLIWVAFSIHTVLCTFNGPIFPAPFDLTSNDSLVAESWHNITARTSELLGTTSGVYGPLQNVTFSFGAFSIHDTKASELFQFHHTGPQTLNAANGTKSVDANSIYRVASITKVFTTYIGLLVLSKEQWQTPISHIFPELATSIQNATGGGAAVTDIYNTHWDQITPWMLASHLSGMPDSSPLPFGTTDLLFYAPPGKPLPETTLPDVNFWDPRIEPPCWSPLRLDACTPEEILAAIAWRDPAFQPVTQPDYADPGFIILGLVLQTLTGKSLQQLLDEHVMASVGINSTYYQYPGDQILDRCVITGSYDDWTHTAGQDNWGAGTGELKTSLSDLARVGVSVLNSTLLSPLQTREWLQPHSFTSNVSYAVGMPWEISRYVSPSTGKVTNIFAKSGQSDDATTFIVLLPDYGAGFCILATNTVPGSIQEASRHTPITLLTDEILQALIPALEAQAATEATANFIGTYVAPGDLNSSITIAHNTTAGAQPGLTTTKWIYNGTNLLNETLMGELFYIDRIILQQTIDSRDANTGAGQVAFRHNQKAPGIPPIPSEGTGVFAGAYLGDATEWIAEIGLIVYAGVGLDLLVFNTVEGGKAVSLEHPAFRVTLERQG